MPGFEPHTRFLLRGSGLLVALLTLWWFVLLTPMLYVLKGAAGVLMSIEENGSGDWTLRVPLKMTLPATAQPRLAQNISSIDFDLPRADAIAFTFSLPVYWAIILAAPGGRRCWCPLLVGTALMCAAELVLLLAFAQITARNAAAQLAGSDDAVGKWIRHFGEYLIVSVVPYVLPFAIALSMHGELRTEVFSLGKEPEAFAASKPACRAERRRAKNRR